MPLRGPCSFAERLAGAGRADELLPAGARPRCRAAALQTSPSSHPHLLPSPVRLSDGHLVLGGTSPVASSSACGRSGADLPPDAFSLRYPLGHEADLAVNALPVQHLGTFGSLNGQAQSQHRPVKVRPCSWSSLGFPCIFWAGDAGDSSSLSNSPCKAG